MFKVLIVDDEPFIRKGLVNIIHWKSFDCEVCGEGADGVEGLELMESLKPDIVFVDINMPEINGLEMIRLGKERLPKSKFVILTGYRDFSYLQEAIKIGAYDYILKPSKIEEISEILKRAVMELKYEQAQEIEQQKLKEKFEESIPILKEKMLFDLINGYSMPEQELKYNLRLYQLELDAFVVLYARMDEENLKENQKDQRYLYQFGLINTFTDLFGDYCHVEKVILDPNKIAFILSSQTGPLFDLDRIASIAGNVQQLVENCFDFTVTVAISSVGERAEQIKEKAFECEECLAYRFYMGPNSILLYKDLKGFYKREDLSGLDRYEKQLTLSIQAGDESQVLTTLNELRGEVIAYNAKPEQIKQYYWTIIYNINHIRLSMKALEKSVDEKANDMTSLYKLIDESGSILEIHELVETVAMNIVTRINQYNRQNINVILQQAMTFIKNNYQKSITLQDLASETFVSTYYLSRMFTKELNKNYVDYLNEIRMEAACELLKDPSYKTYEVSELVGISDAHYFSKLFKKYVGVTPTEYRNNS